MMDYPWLSNDAELQREILQKVNHPSFKAKTGIIIDSTNQEQGLLPSNNEEEEAIILNLGRPVLLVTKNGFSEPLGQTWGKRLREAKNNIIKAIPSVGRIELRNDLNYDWVGTGWMISKDILVTNRHVARIFCTGTQRDYDFRITHLGRSIRANVDFLEEYQQDKEAEFRVKEILYIADDSEADVALFRIDPKSLDNIPLPSPIPLSKKTAKAGQYIVTIGYPAEDGRRNPPIIMKRIFQDIYDVKRLSPGRIITANNNSITHDCTTLGGNSGSVLVDLKTGNAVGLHFAGKYSIENHAVSAEVIARLLEKYE